MGKVIIIGAGGVGTVVAHKCAQHPEVFSEIVIASRTKSKCDALAKTLGKDYITTDSVDTPSGSMAFSAQRRISDLVSVKYGDGFSSVHTSGPIKIRLSLNLSFRVLALLDKTAYMPPTLLQTSQLVSKSKSISLLQLSIFSVSFNLF